MELIALDQINVTHDLCDDTARNTGTITFQTRESICTSTPHHTALHTWSADSATPKTNHTGIKKLLITIVIIIILQ